MTSQALSLPLLRGRITLEDALEQEEDMLLEVSYPDSRLEFFVFLVTHRDDIAALVSDHLGLDRSNQCRVGEVEKWLYGSFNVCIPVYVDNWNKGPTKRVLIRFPLPYKVGESTYPGNADEKLRCEAATFIWIRKHHLDIPIPRLWGFGLSGGQTFTTPESMPVMTRAIWYLRRCVSWLLGFPLPCPYVIHNRQQVLEHGYLIMDYIDEPDILSCHDSRIRHQPNSIDDEEDGRDQVANLSIMRALLPHFTNRELRQGPFFYRFTDLHPSNIFVDDQWHIKYLVDLEWACSLPAETLRPPYWLTGHTIDHLLDECLTTFSKEHDKLMEIFEQEERQFPPLFSTCTFRTNIMSKGWKVGNFWFFHALDSPKGLYNLFRDHIQPIFAPSQSDQPLEFSRIVSEYWAVDTKDVMEQKLKDREVYQEELRLRFQNALDRTTVEAPA
ncbi:hypothetical protein N7535_006093 [Penicillium sp. DV-2018c]|nr:hypothetical protein N7535_006093 [Penicillium sp. DV-2018c]